MAEGKENSRRAAAAAPEGTALSETKEAPKKAVKKTKEAAASAEVSVEKTASEPVKKNIGIIQCFEEMPVWFL